MVKPAAGNISDHQRERRLPSAASPTAAAVYCPAQADTVRLFLSFSSTLTHTHAGPEGVMETQEICGDPTGPAALAHLAHLAHLAQH